MASQLLALSIFAPAVQQIMGGSKRYEIRSWFPDELPLFNLALVENASYLKADGDEELGLLRAFVDVIAVSPWTQTVADQSGAEWQPGYFAWQLANVRSLRAPIRSVARRRLYPLAELSALPGNLERCW